jgi:hypothetical protein
VGRIRVRAAEIGSAATTTVSPYCEVRMVESVVELSVKGSTVK